MVPGESATGNSLLSVRITRRLSSAFALEAEFETSAGFTMLLGPSGCGKTTTLRMVAGLESITSGHISIDEKIVNELPPMDRDIAMVFQNYALYPHMSVYDNMAFGLKMRKFPRAEVTPGGPAEKNPGQPAPTTAWVR